jgi:putative transposase
MYRLLAADGPVRDRRDQLAHPAHTAPELLARSPNEVWSWDITKLKGPAKWTYFYLYVILDVYSRYVVGWTVQRRETGPLAEQLITDTLTKQQIGRDQLTIHADRGSSMTSKPVAFLLADLGVTKSHSSALHLDRQPILRGALQDAEVPARIPRPLRHTRASPRVLPTVLRLLQRRALPLRDRADDPHDRSSRPRRADPRRPRRGPQRRLRGHAGQVREPFATPTGATNRRLDQQARERRGPSLNSQPRCLTRLDRLR